MKKSVKKLLIRVTVTTMVFLNLNSLVVKENVSAQELPNLWITELMVNSPQDSGVSNDQYEYIEIYNAGTESVNIKDYSIKYIYPTNSTPLTWDIKEDKILPSKGTIVVWNKNTNYTNKTIADFNKTYSVNLREDQICSVVSGGMANSGERTIAIQTDDERIISNAVYNRGNQDVVGDKSIIYGAPDLGTNIMKMLLSASKPSPGTQPSFVRHIQSIESTPPADLSIDTRIYEENMISSAKVYYRTSLDSEFSSVDLIQDTADSMLYRAIVPKESIGFVKFLQYYIQVIDEGNTITLPETSGTYYNIAIEQKDIVAPIIEHTQVLTSTKPADISISANVSDETQVSSVKLYYKTSKQTSYDSINMTLIQGTQYQGVITLDKVSEATWVQYYIEATDGINTGTLPKQISAPFNITILQADNEPPIIQHVQAHDSHLIGDISIRAIITDNKQVTNSRVYYKTTRMSEYRFIDMIEDPLKQSEFEAVIPKSELIGVTSVKYFIETSDGINRVTLPEQTSKAYSINIEYDTPELLIPELLITEMLPNPSAGPGASGDPYEFIELYNASSHPVNLKDYQLVFYPTPEDRRVNDIIEDKIIQPGKTMVLWIYTKDSKTANKRLTDFNDHYSVNLTDEQLYLMDVTLPGTFNLYNSAPARTIILTKDNGDLVCRATFNDTSINDSVTDKSVIYSYPQAGSFDMIKIGSAVDPTVGKVIIDQIPPDYNDHTAPTVEHNQTVFTMMPSDLKIQAKAYDDGSLRTVKLWYKTSNMSSAASINMVKSTTEQDIFETVISKAEIGQAITLQYYIEATDGINTTTAPKTSGTFYTVEIGDFSGPVVSNIYPYDKFYLENNYRPSISASYTDPSEVNAVKVKLYLDGIDVTSKAVITDNNIIYNPEEDLPVGEHNVKIQVYDKSTAENITEKIWSFEVGPEIYNQYQGQIHSHTSYSDGKGTPDEAYAWARDMGKADFFGLTDHSHYFDFDGRAWNELREIADKYNDPGKYATIPGFEMTWDGNTGFWGHMNVFNTEWSESRQNLHMTMPELYEKLSQTPGSLGQFNHPVFYWGDFADFEFYSEEADKAMNLIELKSLTNDWLYSRALDKGWHISPANNEDNHSKAWMTASNGATVVIAPKLTRENILEAFAKNRTYSTMDRNLRIQYKINDNIMGSTITNPDKLNFDIELSDADENIGKVTVVADGGFIVTTKQFKTKSTKWQFELPAEYSYYYLRVEQADGNLAVTAPIWVEGSKLVTISETKLALKDWDEEKPVQAISIIKNNGNLAAEDVKVEIFLTSTLDANKIGEVTLGSLRGGEEKTAIIDLPTVDSKASLYVQVSSNTDGRSKKAVGYINIPTLLITEIVADTSADPGETGEPYEFVEIYNNSNKTINLRDYKIVYYIGTDNFKEFDIAKDKNLPARSAMVLWIKSADMNTQVKQLSDFNNHYGINLQREQVLEVNGTLDNTGGKMLFLAKDSGEKLNYASYNLYLDQNKDVVINRSINYRYAQNGTDQVVKIASNQMPTPGIVFENQVPAVITDNNEPVTSAEIIGSNQNGWYSSEVRINLTAEDDMSGMNKIEYSLDDGKSYIEGSTIILQTDGTYIVYYRSSDKSGNIETPKKLEIKIDRTLPTFELSVDGNPIGSSGSFEDIQLLSFKALDNLSGVERINIDIKNQLTGNSIYIKELQGEGSVDIDLIGKPQTCTALITVTDIAGNTTNAAITIDITASINSMEQLIRRYGESEVLKKPLLVQLQNLLEAAKHQFDKGELVQAVKHMEDFIKHLHNNSMDMYIDDNVKLILGNDARYLVDKWSLDK
jgi:hypothetical protein